MQQNFDNKSQKLPSLFVSKQTGVVSQEADSAQCLEIAICIAGSETVNDLH